MSHTTKKKPRRTPPPSRVRSWQRPSARSSDTAYDRSRDLPRLLPIAFARLCPDAQAASIDLMVFLRRALRRERLRGIAGHWAYDLGRHAALLRAYRAELDAITPTQSRASPGSGQPR